MRRSSFEVTAVPSKVAMYCGLLFFIINHSYTIRIFLYLSKLYPGWAHCTHKKCHRQYNLCLLFTSHQPYRKIIHFIEDENANPWNGYLYALSLFLVSLGQSILSHNMVFVQFTTNIRTRNAMMSAIYNKVRIECVTRRLTWTSHFGARLILMFIRNY